MKMIKSPAVFLLSYAFLSLVSANAQIKTSTAVQQSQDLQQNIEQQKPLLDLRAGTKAPETYTNEDSDIGAQHILRVIPRPTKWEVGADSRYYYTDNAQLAQNGPLISSSVFVNTISAAYAPTPYKVGDGRFAPSAGYRMMWVNYEGGLPSVNDFNSQTAFVGAKYMMADNWTVFGEFDYIRIVQQPDYNKEFYHDFAPTLGVQKLFQPNQNSLVSVSLLTDYNFAWAPTVYPDLTTHNDGQDRMDETLNLAYSWQPTAFFVVQPYYRLTYTYYRFTTAHTKSRDDVLNTFGLSASYYFTQWLSLQAFANYDVKSSDDNSVPGYNPGYRAYDVGLDLTATFRF
jgi:hypothetical protein